jgi:tetratricopeptide (TPR) repeat protein
LDALATDDESTTVRAVFSLSYHALKPEAARTFRLLGLHEGAQISEPAAAALTDLPVSQIRQLLGVLCRGHLLERVGAHRYQFHDLLRLYAAERAEAEESDDERRRIVRGMLRWYLRTASAADRILCPGRFRGPTEGLPAPVPAPDLAGHRQALAWCETENGNLVAALRQANTAGEHALAWQLAWAQWGFFDLRKPWAQWLTSYQIGLESARALGDRSAEALLLNGLGTAYYYPRRFREALDCYQRAQSIWRDTGDLRGQASVAGNLGNLLLETRQLPAAVEQFQQALALHSGDDGHAAAITLGNLAEALCLLGRFGPALDHARRALALHRAAGSRRSEALILAQAGNALRGLGRAEEALAQYAGALRVSRLIGDRQAEGWACHFLAEALYAADRRIPAHRYWQRAIALFDALGDPQAGDIRVRLAALGAADHVSQQV